MHAISHGGCADTVKESALKVDSRKKIPCPTGDSNPRQYRALAFSRTFYPLSYPGPASSMLHWPNYMTICALETNNDNSNNNVFFYVQFLQTGEHSPLYSMEQRMKTLSKQDNSCVREYILRSLSGSFYASLA